MIALVESAILVFLLHLVQEKEESALNSAGDYSWYENKLKALKFRVSVETTPNSVGHLVSNTSDNHRTFNMRNYPTVPENSFTVELMEK